jgi:hypothetical protein
LQKVIDVMKIDIEGAEWPFLHQFINTDWPRQFKQLIFEIHTPTFKGTPMTREAYDAVIKDLQLLQSKHHYRLYRELHNNGCCGRFSPLLPPGLLGSRQHCCFELYYINPDFAAPTN